MCVTYYCRFILLFSSPSPSLRYVNYVSLYLELGLLLWIGVKFVLRRLASTRTSKEWKSVYAPNSFYVKILPSMSSYFYNYFINRIVFFSCFTLTGARRFSFEDWQSNFPLFGVCCRALSRASHANKTKAASSSFRLPTRLIASVTLAILLVSASAWRLGHMWDGLAVAMDEVRIAVMLYKVPPPRVCVLSYVCVFSFR